MPIRVAQGGRLESARHDLVGDDLCASFRAKKSAAATPPANQRRARCVRGAATATTADVMQHAAFPLVTLARAKREMHGPPRPQTRVACAQAAASCREPPHWRSMAPVQASPALLPVSLLPLRARVQGALPSGAESVAAARGGGAGAVAGEGSTRGASSCSPRARLRCHLVAHHRRRGAAPLAHGVRRRGAGGRRAGGRGAGGRRAGGRRAVRCELPPRAQPSLPDGARAREGRQQRPCWGAQTREGPARAPPRASQRALRAGGHAMARCCQPTTRVRARALPALPSRVGGATGGNTTPSVAAGARKCQRGRGARGACPSHTLSRWRLARTASASRPRCTRCARSHWANVRRLLRRARACSVASRHASKARVAQARRCCGWGSAAQSRARVRTGTHMPLRSGTLPPPRLPCDHKLPPGAQCARRAAVQQQPARSPVHQPLSPARAGVSGQHSAAVRHRRTSAPALAWRGVLGAGAKTAPRSACTPASPRHALSVSLCTARQARHGTARHAPVLIGSAAHEAAGAHAHTRTAPHGCVGVAVSAPRRDAPPAARHLRVGARTASRHMKAQPGPRRAGAGSEAAEPQGTVGADAGADAAADDTAAAEGGLPRGERCRGAGQRGRELGGAWRLHARHTMSTERLAAARASAAAATAATRRCTHIAADARVRALRGGQQGVPRGRLHSAGCEAAGSQSGGDGAFARQRARARTAGELSQRRAHARQCLGILVSPVRGALRVHVAEQQADQARSVPRSLPTARSRPRAWTCAHH